MRGFFIDYYVINRYKCCTFVQLILNKVWFQNRFFCFEAYNLNERILWHTIY